MKGLVLKTLWRFFSLFLDNYLECLSYSNLTSATRKTTYHTPDGKESCDAVLDEGWFRFQGDAGTKMPTSCVPDWRCGTVQPGWLSGSHPTETEGEVERTVCFRRGNDCCQHSIAIKVRNCGSYYIYYLFKTKCNHRYCSTDWWRGYNYKLQDIHVDRKTWFPPCRLVSENSTF